MIKFEKHRSNGLGENMWKDINGFEGLYQVSDTGEVKSLSRVKPNNRGTQQVNERILHKRTDKDGYFAVCLSKDGKHYGKRVNRLVADAFIPNPENHPVVNHIDEDKQNNNVSNLEWCTVKHNTLHGTGRIKTAMAQGRAVQKINLEGDVVEEFYSTCNASTKTGIPQSNIYKACSGERHTAGGYKWRFKYGY